MAPGLVYSPLFKIRPVAHKTLNRVEETVDKIYEDVNRLEGIVVNEAAELKELLTGSSIPEDMTSAVEIRNLWLERVRIAQSHANVAQEQISDNKFKQKMLTMKESTLAANQKKIDAMLEKKKEDRNAKAAEKEAKEKTLADKKAAAASKKAAAASKKAAAKKAVGGRKRKTSTDPEVAAIEAQTDADIARIQAGNFAQSSDANDLTHWHRLMAFVSEPLPPTEPDAETANVCLAAPEQSDEPLPPTEPHAETANVCLAPPEQSDEPLPPTEPHAETANV